MKILVAFFLLLSILHGYTQNSIEVQYQEDLSTFANPERGYYSHTEAHSTGYSPLNIETLSNLRMNESITQILRVFYLEEFRTRPISDEYLTNIRKDFVTVREAGIKVIIRFAYSQGTSAPYNDATPEVVFTHIGQLAPLLQENADIILTMQAGFVGTWGEWYYTDHFATAPGNISEEDWGNRKKVVEGLLDALPKNRTVQVRTPGYKMIMYDTETPIDSDIAYSGSDQSRIGHHNDCFVASSSDFGTYVNPDVEKPYLETETTFLPMGGETCALAPPYSDCENATSELERFHWSYLNTDYNQAVLNEWDDQGCLEEVIQRLGYRHRLISASMNQESKPSGRFDLSLSIINEGYANFYNPRTLYVILRNNETLEEYTLESETDTRRWPIGEEHTLQFSAGIPASIANGTYSVFISLPDEYPHLSKNPAYSVRFPNLEVWDDESGYNDLLIDLNVSSENTELEDYSGDKFFRSASSETTIEIGGSDLIDVSANDNSVVVYWPIQDESVNRILQRSADGEEFHSLATLNGSQISFTDTDVAESITYTYRYQIVNDQNEITEYSNEINAQLSNATDQINLDGNGDDWGGITPILSASGTNFNVVKTTFKANSAYFLLENSTNYSIYLNTNQDETGMAAENESGFDYKIEDGQVYNVLDNQWNATGSINSATGQDIELEILFSQIPLLTGDNPVIEILAVVDNNLLNNKGRSVMSHYRILPPDIPTIESIENNPNPNIKSLFVYIQECQYCDGFILERSQNDTDNFVEAFNKDRDEDLVVDFDVSYGNKYYYRVKSYNNLGESEYSEVKMKFFESPLGIDDVPLKIYPNPVQDYIRFSDEVSKVTILSLNGELITESENCRSISVEEIGAGIYIIQASYLSQTTTSKFVKSN